MSGGANHNAPFTSDGEHEATTRIHSLPLSASK
jgi:hypothetical protein